VTPNISAFRIASRPKETSTDVPAPPVNVRVSTLQDGSYAKNSFSCSCHFPRPLKIALLVHAASCDWFDDLDPVY